MFNLGKYKAQGMLLTACLLAAASAQAWQSHEHGHAEHASLQLELNAGEPWATDAALREGMEQIREAAQVARQAELQGQFDSAKAVAMAAAVDAGITHMVQNCKLPADADANLHILLGQLSSAAHAAKTEPASAEGLPKLLGALDRYPRYFSHPGWPVAAPAAHSDAEHSDHAH